MAASDDYSKLFRDECLNSKWRLGIETLITVGGWLWSVWLWWTDAARWQLALVTMLSAGVLFCLLYLHGRNIFVRHARTQAKHIAQLEERIRILESLRTSDFKFEVGGFRFATPDNGSNEFWIECNAISITNRSDQRIPLELVFDIGLRADGRGQYFEGAVTTPPPEWLAKKLHITTEHKFGRYVNVTARTSMNGYCLFGVSDEILKWAGVNTVDELASRRPIWLEVTNKLTEQSVMYPLNVVADLLKQANARGAKPFADSIA